MNTPDTPTEPITSRPSLLTRPSVVLALIVFVALALRLPFLMHSLDEVDSSNFALGAVHFDIGMHQPHPLGQFYYVMLCQAMRLIVHDEITTLSLLSALFSSLALIPYYLILRLVFGRPAPALAATALTAASFGFWLTGLRPISDPVGCFFVYSTLCALLYGLDRPRWFCAGMALFAFQLGVKQLSVYFLAPVVVVVFLIALLKHGWRPALASALLFAAVLLGWLVPTVLNAGSLQRFLDLSRQQQAETYLYESLVTHLTAAQAAMHADYVAVWPWGFVPLAVLMIVLAVLGLAPLWRAGLRARLFLLFGLTTIGYIFLVLSTFSKYFVYTVPFYCALAIAGLEGLTSLPPVGRLVPPGRAFAGGVTALILAGLGATLPLLGQVSSFRSPVQSAYEYLVRQHGPDLHGIDVLTNQGGSVPPCLRYYRLKSGLGFADLKDNFLRVVPELTSGRQLYILSFIPGGGSTERLELLDTYTWSVPLRKILQAWPLDHHLFIYKVRGELPANYALRDQQITPLLFANHVDADGWAYPDCDIILPCAVDTPVAFVRLQGTIPGRFGFHFPMTFHCEARGTPPHGAGTFTISQPESFDVLLALDKPSAGNYLDLHVQAPESYFPPDHDGADADPRHMAWQFTGLQCTSAQQPLLISTDEGSWYERESAGAHSWRWCREEGRMEVAASRAGTLTVRAAMLSSRGSDRVDVLLDGARVASVEMPNPGAVPAQTFRVPVQPGLHTLGFRGQRPGEKPTPGDGRLLSVGVQDLQISLE